jgi:uncharacterized protein YfbU (UPF0304 family)
MLNQIFQELKESSENNIITILEIGKALLSEKQNNPQNINWIKEQLTISGFTVKVKR